MLEGKDSHDKPNKYANDATLVIDMNKYTSGDVHVHGFVKPQSINSAQALIKILRSYGHRWMKESAQLGDDGRAFYPAHAALFSKLSKMDEQVGNAFLELDETDFNKG